MPALKCLLIIVLKTIIFEEAFLHFQPILNLCSFTSALFRLSVFLLICESFPKKSFNIYYFLVDFM